MNRQEELKRRIKIKQQLIEITNKEIEAMEEELNAATEDHRKRLNSPALPL